MLPVGLTLALTLIGATSSTCKLRMFRRTTTPLPVLVHALSLSMNLTLRGVDNWANERVRVAWAVPQPYIYPQRHPRDAVSMLPTACMWRPRSEPSPKFHLKPDPNPTLIYSYLASLHCSRNITVTPTHAIVVNPTLFYSSHRYIAVVT